MAYTLDVNLALGASNTGLTLEMQLKNTAGVNVGAAVTSGFVEFDSSGCYLFHYAGWPDGHRGAAVFQVSPGGAVKAAVAINPEEAEYTDQKTSTVDTSVWAYPVRTLTSTAAEIIATLEGSTIIGLRGDTLSVSLVDLGDITGRTDLYFSVKDSLADTDLDAIVQITEAGGLSRLNGAAGTAADGSLTVDDALTGDVTVLLKAAAMAALRAPQSYRYDVQMVTATTVTTLTSGTFRVAADVTRAIT